MLSSATLDAERFADFFAPPKRKKWDIKASEVSKHPESVALMSVEGRQHPVQLMYAARPVSDYVQQLIETVVNIHCSEPAGDVLCFVTGQEECETAVQLISDGVREVRTAAPILVVPLYAGLKIEEQMAAFEEPERGTRKVVVATNIAETSVTIDGIMYVVDCGFVKQRLYNPTLDSETLSIVPVSQAQAIQRSGRAGRVGPGKAYRLYTEKAYQNLEKATIPELQRVRLDWPVLQLKVAVISSTMPQLTLLMCSQALGITDILHFNFMSPPLPQAMMRALELLFALGALDKQVLL